MREACSRCGTRKEDWLDDEGMPHEPPILEPIVKSCPGCAEMTRLRVAVHSRARAAAGTGPSASDLMESSLGGVSIGVGPFDPGRDVLGEEG